MMLLQPLPSLKPHEHPSLQPLPKKPEPLLPLHKSNKRIIHTHEFEEPQPQLPEQPPPQLVAVKSLIFFPPEILYTVNLCGGVVYVS